MKGLTTKTHDALKKFTRAMEEDLIRVQDDKRETWAEMDSKELINKFRENYVTIDADEIIDDFDLVKLANYCMFVYVQAHNEN